MINIENYYKGKTLQSSFHWFDFLNFSKIGKNEKTTWFQNSVNLSHELLKISITMTAFHINDHISKLFT